MPMLWTLMLAHLLADYPLQTDWMVKMKRTWQGLTLHVAIHFVTMIVLLWPASAALWPYLLVLAGLHFAIDTLKNLLSIWRPQWVIRTYAADQLLHLLSIWLIATWIEQAAPAPTPLLGGTPVIYAIGYLLATYVWSISERILAHMNPAYQAEVELQLWPRMALRAALLTVILLGSRLAAGTTAIAAVAIFYLSSQFGRRALLTDIGVTFGSVTFILLAH
jgi:hypothetical protein